MSRRIQNTAYHHQHYAYHRDQFRVKTCRQQRPELLVLSESLFPPRPEAMSFRNTPSDIFSGLGDIDDEKSKTFPLGSMAHDTGTGAGSSLEMCVQRPHQRLAPSTMMIIYRKPKHCLNNPTSALSLSPLYTHRRHSHCFTQGQLNLCLASRVRRRHVRRHQQRAVRRRQQQLG